MAALPSSIIWISIFIISRKRNEGCRNNRKAVAYPLLILPRERGMGTGFMNFFLRDYKCKGPSKWTCLFLVRALAGKTYSTPFDLRLRWLWQHKYELCLQLDVGQTKRPCHQWLVRYMPRWLCHNFECCLQGQPPSNACSSTSSICLAGKTCQDELDAYRWGEHHNKYPPPDHHAKVSCGGKT